MQKSPQYDPAIKEMWKTLFPALMRGIKKDVDRRCKGEMDRHGLSKLHLGYLMSLSCGLNTMRSLSEGLCMDKANTTRAIADLRSKGLVVDDREKETSKKYTLSLTDEGLSLTTQMKQIMDDAFDEYMYGIPSEEVLAMIATLRKIKGNLDVVTESCNMDPKSNIFK